MVSKWRKAKMVLSCMQTPRTSTTITTNDDNEIVNLRASHSSSTHSSKKKCAICLSTMISGRGLAIFTAECSHSFHYNCITSNLKNGNQFCPICSAKWKEIPFENHLSKTPIPKYRTDSIGISGNDHLLVSSDTNHNISSVFHAPEPRIFDDDDNLTEEQNSVSEEQSISNPCTNETSNSFGRVEIKTYPEFPAIPKSSSFGNFTILIHLKAPVAKMNDSRAPVDLVTVLDVSGSMGGTKLALLKRAMGFVIQHLGNHDRLSVIAFSSTARRLFPLRLMDDNGKVQALQAVNTLSSNGGTNITEGLKMGSKVMLERKFKNPVSSIILLSDGQDTYTQSRSDYKSLLPVSIQQNSDSSVRVPVHAFGFGADHDSESMHSISENSGGTFSFIEAESVMQDAFALCLGGLLSVAVQQLRVEIECLYPGLELSEIKAGSYPTNLMSDSRTGCIQVGDLYAEEEKDFLLTITNVPPSSVNEMSLLKVSYSYKDPLTKEPVPSIEAEVTILRPDTITETMPVCIEMDRQRNRVNVAEAMSGARTAAERGELANAVSILDECNKALSESVAGQVCDDLSVMLGMQLKEMKERMLNRKLYETSGRACVLSGLSSHSWQRATVSSCSSSNSNLSQQLYQTSSMVDMITRSRTMVLGGCLSMQPRLPVRPPPSLSEPPRPSATVSKQRGKPSKIKVEESKIRK